MNLIQVSVFEGSEKQINLSLNNAISTESWILIENLHLGNKTWLRNFTKRLQRLFNQLGNRIQLLFNIILFIRNNSYNALSFDRSQTLH